jgi:uncharacterized protein (TIGR02099 family)
MSFFARSTAAVRRLALRSARWLLGLALLGWAVVLAGWLTLHWAILPHINDWRPDLERLASQTLGLKVKLGQIELRSGGWIPALELRDVRLLDPAGREALQLPRVAAALSARSLLAFELRFSQLLIDRPELEIRRDAQGRLFVAGLAMDGDAAAPEAAQDLADWFFSQHEFVILQGRVRWIDEQRGAPPLELSGLDLALRNGLRRHELRLDATPPAEWGERFALRGRFTQSLLRRPGELKYWSGQLYAELPRADVRTLRRHLDLPFELDEGDGALRAWADFKDGQAQGLTLDMALRAVHLRLGKSMEPLALARIEGRVALQRQPEGGVSLSATQLGFEGDDGLVWPRSDWSLSLRRQGEAVIGGELKAQQMDLALMGQIATRLPLGEQQRQWLAELAPQGRVRELQARWDGPLDAPRSYRIKAGLEGLSLAAKAADTAQGADTPGRPGLAGANLQLDAHEKGGQARLSVQDGMLEFPGVFEQPQLPLSRLNAALDWRIEPRPNGRPPAVELRVSNVELANEDLRGALEAVWKTGAGGASGSERGRGGRFPGHLDLQGRLDQAQAARVARYLPLGLGAAAREYVRDAVRGGEARQVQFKVRGDLWDFPFDAVREGQFRISLQAQDVQLAYVPSHAATATAPAYDSPWPAMDKVSAELVFERGSMAIRNGRARVLGYELNGVNGGFKDLLHRPVLELEGQGRGPLAELLRFTKASPVGGWIGGALEQASASGPAGLRLALQIPLDEVARTTVKGQVLLAGNDVRLRPDVPLLGNARARIDFDRRGVTIQGGQARVLGGDATFEGGSQRDGSLRFTGQGVATAEALRRAPELGLVARLAPSLSGQATYRLQLGFKEGGSELLLSSSLQGLGADLPAPLNKAPEASLPLRYQTSLLSGGREELRFELGALVQALYQRDAASGRVLAGAVALQDALPGLPTQGGVLLQASLGQVNLDAWQAVAQRLGGAASWADAAAGEGGGYVPSQLTLRARGLQLGGRALNKVQAQLTRGMDQQVWRAQVEAEQLSGALEWRAARAGQPARLHARLARLSLPKSEAESVSQLLDPRSSANAASEVPALDIVVEDFELRGKRLGRLEVDAQAQGREWKLTKLQLRHPDAVLNATGHWSLVPGQAQQRRTVLDWKLDVADAGNLLERLGQGRILRGGKGQAAGQIGWAGSPLDLDYASMSGQLKIALDAGQFLQAEPGVGRLLGILSLQSLPRRLILDFRDVFSEGFAFDGFGGDVKIERGVASSQNLRMSGVQAVVAMEGSADLARETQDLRVLVVPEINAGGASLAYAAINPAVGLGTFLAQLLLRKPMMAANTREFRVTGSWDDPKVERVERVERKAEAGPAASSP